MRGRAFALIGDRYHNPDYIRTALDEVLVEGTGLTIDYTSTVEDLDAGALEGREMLIIFRDAVVWPQGYGETEFAAGRESVPLRSEPPVPEHQVVSVPWMRPEQGAAVRGFVEGGGAALLYHNVTYIGSHNADFRRVLGAVTQGHPPVRAFRVEVTNPGHPITRGVRDFLVTDEQHYMTYEADPAHVLLRSVEAEGRSFGDLGPACEAGWAFDLGRGRVCYLAPGHMIAPLWNPQYVKVQQNAARWLLREIG